MKEDYNYRGIKLSSEKEFVPIDRSFFTEEGLPRWSENIQNADAYGFDTRNIEKNGYYIIKTVLPAGKKVVRYGNDSGSFTTEVDSVYSQLSLPYTQESMPYHEYVVKEDCEVICFVDKGKVAPGFGLAGGAIQYRHYHKIHDSVMLGILEEDVEWLQKLRIL